MPTTGKADAFPLDMVIEVYGIIYIYNPPQADSLGIEKVDENTVVEGTALGEGRVDETVAADPTAEPVPVVTPDAAVPQAADNVTVDPAVPTQPAVPAVDPAVPAQPAVPTVDPAVPENPAGVPTAPVVDPSAGAGLVRPRGLSDLALANPGRPDSAFIFAG
jgi:hypothetical protein